ncbi:hypothetical protein [Sorangium sp. So ce693]
MKIRQLGHFRNAAPDTIPRAIERYEIMAKPAVTRALEAKITP